MQQHKKSLQSQFPLPKNNLLLPIKLCTSQPCYILFVLEHLFSTNRFPSIKKFDQIPWLVFVQGLHFFYHGLLLEFSLFKIAYLSSRNRLIINNIYNKSIMKMLGGLYLSSFLLTLSNLLKIGVYGSTSSSDLDDSSSSSESNPPSFYIPNIIFSSSFPFGTYFLLEVLSTSLKITFQLYIFFLVIGFLNL